MTQKFIVGDIVRSYDFVNNSEHFIVGRVDIVRDESYVLTPLLRVAENKVAKTQNTIQVEVPALGEFFMDDFCQNGFQRIVKVA